MQIIDLAAIRPAPWKNGGGLTREIARRDDENGVIWRLSVAEVGSNGPFSLFPGLARVLTVIAGGRLILRHPAGVIEAAPGTPVHFPGDLPIDAELPDGPLRDFNLIFNPARAAMDVIALAPGRHFAAGLGVFALAGGISVAGAKAGENCFVFFDSAQPVEFVSEGGALLVTMCERLTSQKHQARASSAESVFR